MCRPSTNYVSTSTEKTGPAASRPAELAKLIGDREVRCDDLGPDPTARKRRLGVCKIEGETTSLSQLLVGKGFALNVESSATGRFKVDEAQAREDRQGLWRGCFVAPQEFRSGKKDGALLGGSCPTDRDKEIREALFPDDLAMPSGCNIKGKFAVRARHRQYRHLSSAGLPELSGADQAGPLVLFRGGCTGCRVPPGL
jgi:hypothetical protein